MRANVAIYSNSEGRYSVEGGTQVLEDFGGNVDHATVTVGLGLALGGSTALL